MAALLVGLTAACASTSDGTSYDRNLITLEEIQSMGQTNAYDIIQRARPQWLRPRGWNEDDLTVYLDGSRIGDTDVLRNIQRQDIEVLRFLNASEAMTRYGSGHGSGVIEVESRRASY